MKCIAFMQSFESFKINDFHCSNDSVKKSFRTKIFSGLRWRLMKVVSVGFERKHLRYFKNPP